MTTALKRAGIGLAATALIVGVGGAATLPASGSNKTTTHTLRLNSISKGQHQVGGRSFTGIDVDKRHGKVLGYDTLSGKFNVKTHIAVLDVAAALRGGLLYIHGRSTEAGDFTGRVTGGTGRFHGAAGTVTGTQVNNNTTKIVIHYTLPG
jgi:hypothetical protein